MITAVHTLIYASDEDAARTFFRDDLEATIATLTAKGAEFSGEISEQRWGRTINLKVPGAGEMLLYQPLHPIAHS